MDPMNNINKIDHLCHSVYRAPTFHIVSRELVFKDFSMKHLLIIISKYNIFQPDSSWDLLPLLYSTTVIFFKLSVETSILFAISFK